MNILILDETAVTMCKMIDLRCKMEKLSMKRNKKKSPKGKGKHRILSKLLMATSNNMYIKVHIHHQSISTDALVLIHNELCSDEFCIGAFCVYSLSYSEN